MDALSSEWRRNVQYLPGDRVAFKLGDAMGVAAFECLILHISSFANQPAAGGTPYWKHYPKGFPRKS
ncbi:hypothetical protein CVT25_011628 [Psilocybe cyanescens]|uniref:Uncharacterized protein n=1 Tax=Psilocybe cyanescens TaxID=93625 RepID=A0A409WIT2_PSICY|nr:hypothetical protein CVT25_011628 [Psilocybe cyanescens]